eukprot:TRINITY_DN11274_c0_g1_i1.p1 TRINITY_DN11274_c0_g1~~TRINITY_DN11274_c0_g1_i1.p1  ORF type:complete len:202 (+),score=45.07 TRINITY_DN11274_c0_g1_i1:28-633(+)
MEMVQSMDGLCQLTWCICDDPDTPNVMMLRKPTKPEKVIFEIQHYEIENADILGKDEVGGRYLKLVLSDTFTSLVLVSLDDDLLGSHDGWSVFTAEGCTATPEEIETARKQMALRFVFNYQIDLDENTSRQVSRSVCGVEQKDVEDVLNQTFGDAISPNSRKDVQESLMPGEINIEKIDETTDEDLDEDLDEEKTETSSQE